MPRKVRDSNLETRTARSRLQARHKPYFRLIEPGLHLGYRKLASGPGTWIARRYSGKGSYSAENLRTADDALVLADDYSDADGERVLTFAQAQQKAKGFRVTRSAGSYTVDDALKDYMRLLESDGRPRQAIQDASYKANAFVRPMLGDLRVAALTTERLRRWPTRRRECGRPRVSGKNTGPNHHPQARMLVERGAHPSTAYGRCCAPR
jgi:hypothetical protein